MLQATFYCHMCWRAAATLTLDVGEQQLAVEGFMWQRSVERVTAEQAIQVRRVLRVRDAPGMQLSPDLTQRIVRRLVVEFQSEQND